MASAVTPTLPVTTTGWVRPESLQREVTCSSIFTEFVWPAPVSPPIVTETPVASTVWSVVAATFSPPSSKSPAFSRIASVFPCRSASAKKTPIEPRPKAPPSISACSFSVADEVIESVPSGAPKKGSPEYRVITDAFPVTFAENSALSVTKAWPPAPAPPMATAAATGTLMAFIEFWPTTLTATLPPDVVSVSPSTVEVTLSLFVTSASETPMAAPTAAPARAPAPEVAVTSASDRAVSEIPSPEERCDASLVPPEAIVVTFELRTVFALLPAPVNAAPYSARETAAAAATASEVTVGFDIAVSPTRPPAVIVEDVAASAETVFATVTSIVISPGAMDRAACPVATAKDPAPAPALMVGSSIADNVTSALLAVTSEDDAEARTVLVNDTVKLAPDPAMLPEAYSATATLRATPNPRAKISCFPVASTLTEDPAVMAESAISAAIVFAQVF